MFNNRAFPLLMFSLCLFLGTPAIRATNKGITVTNEHEELAPSQERKPLDSYHRSKRWAIIIGINNYDDQYIQDLTKAQNDAKGLSDLLRNEGQFDHVFTFTDDAAREDGGYATINNVISKMEYLENHIRPDDTLVFSFSGHGVVDDGGKSYLLMADSLIGSPYLTGLPVTAVTDWIDTLSIKRTIILLDACRNYPEKTKGIIDTKNIIAVNDKPAEVSAILYATSPGKYSYEHDERPYSVFTACLLDGLKGKADTNHDIMVTFNELRHYVEQKVNEWAVQNNKYQKPYTLINGEFHGDVVLSVIPPKARAAYNPALIRSSYTKQLRTFKIMNGISLATSLTGFTGGAVGAVMFGIGYTQYHAIVIGDFDTYYYMKNSGLISMTVMSAIGFTALIPFIISYIIKPKVNKSPKLLVDFGYENNRVHIGFIIPPPLAHKEDS